MRNKTCYVIKPLFQAGRPIHVEYKVEVAGLLTPEEFSKSGKTESSPPNITPSDTGLYRLLGLDKLFPKQALVFTCLQYKCFENTLRKGEISRYEQFLLFPQCF